jgi:hypothetical protein
MTLSTPTDNLVAAFQIEGWPVRGRIARLSEVVHDILTRHAYPEPVANLLGEACALAALVGASLKFDGRLIVQAVGQREQRVRGLCGVGGFLIGDAYLKFRGHRVVFESLDGGGSHKLPVNPESLISLRPKPNVV